MLEVCLYSRVNLLKNSVYILTEKIAEMFQSIGIREGSVWIEVFHDGENYYFNEVGFRYGGSVSIYPVDYFYQINQVAADIHYALTGESCISEHTSLIRSTLPRKKYYCIYPVHINAGTISSISGLDKIAQLENIVYLATTKYLHDRLNPRDHSLKFLHWFILFVIQLRNVYKP